MRALPPLLLAVAFVLAGCGGAPFVGGSDEPVPAATPVPGERLTGPDPPGVESGRVLGPTTLGRAHERVIENRSYLLVSNRTVRRADGTLRSRLAVRLALDEDRSFHVDVSTEGPEAPEFLGRPPAEAAYWSDGSTYLRRLTRDGRTTHVEYDEPGTWVGTWSYWARSVPFGGGNNRPSTFYASLFSAVPTRVVDATSVENVTVVRIEARGEEPFSDETFPGDVESVHDVSLVALVDDDGLVRSLDLRYSGTAEGEPVRVHRTVRYEAVGSTGVERPPWYDLVVDGSDEGNGSRGTPRTPAVNGSGSG